jgi:AcrR family transcriptional regulator
MSAAARPRTREGSLDSKARRENALANDDHVAPGKSMSGSAAKTKKAGAANETFKVHEQALSARGQRSREKLKQAAVTCINRSGYRTLRVQDITGEAGVANGLFYRYFEDLNEIAVEIASDLFARLIGQVDRVDPALEPFAWIEQVHLVTVGTFGDNPGILACLFGKSDDENSFSRVWDANAHEWNLRVADRLVAWGVAAPEAARSLCFTLGAVTEGLLYQALVRRTSDLIGVSGGTIAGLARLIATIWHRIIFLASPVGEADWTDAEAAR